jgi:exosome complex RNA-binding protein Rrp4
MLKIASALIPKLPTGCRIGYTYKTRSGKILTFPSAFFKRVAGKSQEFMVVQSNKKQVAIMITNIIGIWVDKSSLKESHPVSKRIPAANDTLEQLIKSMKLLERKLDKLLLRK